MIGLCDFDVRTADQLTTEDLSEIKAFYANEQKKRDRFAVWAERLDAKAAKRKEPAICQCGDPTSCPRSAGTGAPTKLGDDENLQEVSA